MTLRRKLRIATDILVALQGPVGAAAVVGNAVHDVRRNQYGRSRKEGK